MGNEISKEQLSLISYIFSLNNFVKIFNKLADVDELKKHINSAWTKYK